MASVRPTKSGKFELCVRSKLLPEGRVYFTFDSQAEAATYGQQLDRLLAAGIVPADLVPAKPASPREQLRWVLRAWINSGQPARTDLPTLELLITEVGAARIDQLTYQWAENWVREQKLTHNRAPGTIRKRVGSLSRALDWWMRSHPKAMVGNPLRLLPRGASSYSAKDAADLAALSTADPASAPKAARQDVVRDRRLLPGELQRIRAALDGRHRADRERPLSLKDGPALRMLFELILATGLRLREAYTLRRGQIDLAARTIQVKSSKQWHGRVKWRPVPIRPALYPMLDTYLQALPAGAEALVFPWWDGDTDDAALARVTSRLSSQFGRLFDYAQCPGLTEHDIRHEATCQWFELRDLAGQWVFRTEEIDRIMGWVPGSKMSARYASFRAEDLAARLWGGGKSVC